MAAPNFPGAGRVLANVQPLPPQGDPIYKLKQEWMDFFRDNDFGMYMAEGLSKGSPFKDFFYFLNPQDPIYGYIDDNLLSQALFAYAYLQRSIVIPGFGWNRLVYDIISNELKDRLSPMTRQPIGGRVRLGGIRVGVMGMGVGVMERQPVAERVRGGGLRMGEMEQDAINIYEGVEIPPPLKEHDREAYDLSSVLKYIPGDRHSSLEREFIANTIAIMKEISTEDLFNMIESGRQVKSARKR